MNILKSTLMASALILGTASVSFAQDAMTDKAKSMATDKAKGVASDKVKSMMGDKANMVDPAMKVGEQMMEGQITSDMIMTEKGKMDGADMKTAGKVMMKGGSVEDAAMAVAKDNAKDAMMKKASGIMTDNVVGDKMLTEKGKMDGQDMVTAGKVMMQGGSAADAAKAVAKDNAKDLMMDKADSMMKSEMMPQGTVKSVAPTMTAPAVAINCPAGTTAQANGTCMITGNYQPRG